MRRSLTIVLLSLLAVGLFGTATHAKPSVARTAAPKAAGGKVISPSKDKSFRSVTSEGH